MKLEKRDAAPAQNEEAQQPQEPRTEKSMKKREISVMLYTVILFLVALSLILLSYFMQQRSNITISDITAQHGEITSKALQSIDELQEKNLNLTTQLEAAKTDLALAQENLRETREELEEAQGEMQAREETIEAREARIESLEEELETQRKKTEALGMLTALLTAPPDSDLSPILESMESLSQYLDGAYLTKYNEILENLNKEEEEEPNDRHQADT